jgi:outer membrane protein OmpA-like peptidoglycan-associated protein
MSLKHLKTFESFSINEGFNANEIRGVFKVEDRKKNRELTGEYVIFYGNKEIKKGNTRLPMNQGGQYRGEVTVEIEGDGKTHTGRLLISLGSDKKKGDEVNLKYGFGLKGIKWKERQRLIVDKDKDEDDKIPPTVVTTKEFKADAFFDLDSSEIKEAAKKELDSYAANMKGKTVEVHGFASTDGDESHNKELSQNRANAVANYLKAKGVNIKSSTGHGETDKWGKGEENYTKNRRIIVKTI